MEAKLASLLQHESALNGSQASLLQHESALNGSQAIAGERAEQQLPAFARAGQNMATATVLLDTLPTPSTDWAGEVYRWLKSILGTAIVQQAESSLLHRVEASIMPPANPKDGGQRATQGAPEAGIASSPVSFLTCDRPGRPSARSEP
jgi:hypothetical protein